MTKALNDITTRNDIELLVDRFYDQVRTNEILASFFRDVNWPAHLPIMYSFWSSAILGEQSYRGNPFQKHLPLAIGKEHFTEWLRLFKKTVDDNFAGENADQIKSRAEGIAGVFQYKMNLLD
jgi:hemoglobin